MTPSQRRRAMRSREREIARRDRQTQALYRSATFFALIWLCNAGVLGFAVWRNYHGSRQAQAIEARCDAEKADLDRQQTLLDQERKQLRESGHVVINLIVPPGDPEKPIVEKDGMVWQ